jgi:hypothetical protein
MPRPAYTQTDPDSGDSPGARWQEIRRLQPPTEEKTCVAQTFFHHLRVLSAAERSMEFHYPLMRRDLSAGALWVAGRIFA